VVRRRAFVVQLEGQVLALPAQPVNATLQADPVGLEAMAESGLGDAAPGLEMHGQAMEVVEQLGVEGGDVGGHDAAEQDAAEPRRRAAG
jgi:hypothetical protein